MRAVVHWSACESPKFVRAFSSPTACECPHAEPQRTIREADGGGESETDPRDYGAVGADSATSAFAHGCRWLGQGWGAARFTKRVCGCVVIAALMIASGFVLPSAAWADASIPPLGLLPPMWGVLTLIGGMVATVATVAFLALRTIARRNRALGERSPAGPETHKDEVPPR